MKAAFSMTLICIFISKLTLFLVPFPESSTNFTKTVSGRMFGKRKQG
jgi:hypothetical protein